MEGGGTEGSMERGCSLRVGKDWRVHGKGEGRDVAPVEGPLEVLRKEGLEGPWKGGGEGCSAGGGTFGGPEERGTGGSMGKMDCCRP